MFAFALTTLVWARTVRVSSPPGGNKKNTNTLHSSTRTTEKCSQKCAFKRAVSPSPGMTGITCRRAPARNARWRARARTSYAQNKTTKKHGVVANVCIIIMSAFCACFVASDARPSLLPCVCTPRPKTVISPNSYANEREKETLALTYAVWLERQRASRMPGMVFWAQMRGGGETTMPRSHNSIKTDFSRITSERSRDNPPNPRQDVHR